MKQEGFDIKVGRRGPDKLLATFSRSPFWIWVILSLVIHLSVTVFISYGFIRDNYLDPEGAVARKAAALAAEAKPEPPPALKPVAPKPTPPAPSPSATATPTNSTDRMLEERKNTPIVKRITEVAKPDEIPKQPGDLNISLDDTKLK
ncbi:MAG: hypothetical protein WCG79_02525 [Verrucomicrobiota bacterium]|jgi:hypothetical protein